MNDVLSRVAGAPISWGVCEVPGWGHQMSPERVLTEMAEVGLTATELGPDGFLPDEGAAALRLLAEHGLAAVGGFVPLVLHDGDPLPEVERALSRGVGKGVMVLAAVTGLDGYDTRPVQDESDWKTVYENLRRVQELADRHGVSTVLHPHVGTMVENADEVERILAHSDVALCLDTGHLLIGGVDPVALAARAPERVGHVHLKDVDGALAADVRAGRTTYTDAVRADVYRPLGAGDVDVAALLGHLEGAGYRGWYVLEQDIVLAEEPAADRGPIEDVRASVAFLREVAR